jgi:hypothetical protein
MEKSVIFPVDIEKLDMEIQSQVAQWAVLQDIYLVDAKITRDPLIALPEALTLEHKCSTDYPRSPKENYFVLCNFRVVAFDGKEPSKLVMKIEASFFISYVKKPDIKLPVHDDDSLLTYVEYLMKVNPISDAWPYWREFVQNMSSRMGFPALTVPLLEIVPKKSAAKKVKRQPAKKESTKRKKLSA